MKYLSLLILLSSLAVCSQEQNMVIEATTDKNVFLFFPSPISKALSGNGDFQFGYNTQTAEKFGVLKAVAPKGESTLHIITEDQTVYSFIVKYSGNITKFEYFFDGSESVGNIQKTNSDPDDNFGIPSPDKLISDTREAKKITDGDYLNRQVRNHEGDLQFCQDLVAKGDYYKNIFRSKNHITLKLSNVAYVRDKTFFVVTISNKSSVDYDLNFIQFNKIAKKASKKSNYQAIEIRPIEESNYQPFKRIGAFSSHTAVYVFDKLSIDKNKLINIEINELQGERNLQLPVDHSIVNNPNNNL